MLSALLSKASAVTMINTSLFPSVEDLGAQDGHEGASSLHLDQFSDFSGSFRSNSFRSCFEPHSFDLLRSRGITGLEVPQSLPSETFRWANQVRGGVFHEPF